LVVLQGLTVVDVSRLLPGPFCTLILSDLGARVVSVEAPGGIGDITGIEFPMLMRGKERIELDLKREKDNQAFARLVSRSDVLVEGYRPGTAARLGIDFGTASMWNPRLVYCSLTGYGQGSPGASIGHDINFLAVSGLLDLMVQDDGNDSPPIPAVQFADAVGSLAAVIGILSALFERERTGKGRWLDISMADCLPSLAITAFTFHAAGLPHRLGKSPVGGGLACYGLYRTLDRRLLAVGALEAHLFAGLCDALHLPDLVPIQYRPDKQAEVRARLAETFKSKTLSQWETFFSDKDVCVSPVARFEDAVSLPGFIGSGALRPARDPQGADTLLPAFPVEPPPPSVPDRSLPDRSAVPTRGQHTASVLAELGYSAEEIASITTPR